jgi:hypothetical protein
VRRHGAEDGRFGGVDRIPLVLELVLAIAIEDADADGQTLGELGVRAQGEVGAGRGYGQK